MTSGSALVILNASHERKKPDKNLKKSSGLVILVDNNTIFFRLQMITWLLTAVWFFS